MNLEKRTFVALAVLLALFLVAAPASAKKAKRFGLEGKLVNYDEANSTFEVVVVNTKVSGQVGSGGIAGKPAPKSIKKGQTLMFLVEPEGSVLRRTVIKAKTGGGLDNSGTKEGFARAVQMIPRDKNVVFSFEENPAAESGNGVPGYLLKMIQLRLTQAEAEARWNEITQDP